MPCVWCDAEATQDSVKDCYWILPDGKKAIQITDVPAIACPACGTYVLEATSQLIEEKLYWHDVAALGSVFSYSALMKAPRVQNWFLK
ncbi:YokU family protein [Paenibacillus oryzisoli]|uniref:YokU family protein n=1 Tax=Paenibacillus oryzisoli TaxID=1850517 RepID=UPI003D2D2E0C